MKLNIDIYADGADINEMKKAAKEGIVKGFTTNPTLMKKANIQNYTEFAKAAVREIPNMPISFEVFSDDFAGMEKQARIIATWGKNVQVKIPITNTKGESALPLIKKLSHEGVSLNVTALLTLEQVQGVAEALSPKVPAIVSVFAGRIADTGRDPIPTMIESKKILKNHPQSQLLWASTRELLNIYQAEQCGCQIITVSPDILKKLSLVGKDLKALSLETVQMFYNDASSSGFDIG